MSRMKTLTLYVLAIIGFFLFSELLINASLESEYTKIGRRDEISQVVITQAEATRVNGRIKGSVINPEENPINGKYLKFDFYSERGVKVGTKYLKVDTLGESTEKEYKVQFRFDNVKYFTVNLATQEEVDNAQEFELKIEDDIGVPLLFSGLLLLILL